MGWNRGGSLNNNSENCRSANRNRNTPDNQNNNGFRVLHSSAAGMDVPLTEPITFQSDWRFGNRRRNKARSRFVLVDTDGLWCSNAPNGFQSFNG